MLLKLDNRSSRPTTVLRPFQAEALRHLANDCHLLCVAPTGSGKSLIFERIAQKPGSRVLILSPLVALARQIENNLTEAGVPTTRVPRELDIRHQACVVAPESLMIAVSSARIRAWDPTLVVIDECHCIWEWGEDFRPAFGGIWDWVRELGIQRTLWLTATLPRAAVLNWRTGVDSLARAPRIEMGGFALPESLQLFQVEIPAAERIEFLKRWLSAHSEPGMILVTTRSDAERVSEMIVRLDHGKRSVVRYHAGLANEERTAIEARLARGEPLCVVATSAFGMGMDFRQLEWALIFGAPLSLLSLAQAIGRVGRGRAGKACVVWSPEDALRLEWIVQARAREHIGEVLSVLSGRDWVDGLYRAFEA